MPKKFKVVFWRAMMEAQKENKQFYWGKIVQKTSQFLRKV